MILAWLVERIRSDNSYLFNVIEILEKTNINNDIKKYLAKEICNAYRNLKNCKPSFINLPKEKFEQYLKSYVFPNIEDAQSIGERTIRKNVRQGDFGEILASLIAKELRNLDVPMTKLSWKFNKNRSLFGTDLMSHNKGEKITDLTYYEVKTRTSYDKNIAVQGHESLLKDIPNEYIADFVMRYYLELAGNFELNGDNEQANKYREKSNQYLKILTNPEDYKRNFEIVLILEKHLFKEEILEILQQLPPNLEPLTITIFSIVNLNNLTSESYELAKKEAIETIYG